MRSSSQSLSHHGPMGGMLCLAKLSKAWILLRREASEGEEVHVTRETGQTKSKKASRNNSGKTQELPQKQRFAWEEGRKVIYPIMVRKRR